MTTGGMMAGFLPALLLLACAQEPGGGAPAGGVDPRYACQMRGAAAEDRVYGPLGDLTIDTALVRAQVTEDCLRRAGLSGAPPGAAVR